MLHEEARRGVTTPRSRCVGVPEPSGEGVTRRNTPFNEAITRPIPDGGGSGEGANAGCVFKKTQRLSRH